jgi:hypothetical protein
MGHWKVFALLAAIPLLGAAPQDDEARGRRAFERAMTDSHNDARRFAHVPPIAWDPMLAAEAQVWADHLADTGRLEHSKWPRGSDPAGEGENLFMGSEGAYSYAEMVSYWVVEKRSFTNGAMPAISTTGRWQDVGHYSQMIWRTTTRFGCALASGGGQDYLACRYSPPGNVMGQKAL